MSSKVKQRILQLAREKFFKYGINKVSLDELVAELNTSKSSLYNHFRSKEDLVYQVLLSVNVEINQHLEMIINNKKLSFFGKLAEIMEYTGNLLLESGEAFLKDIRLNMPDLWKEYNRLRKDRINRFYRELFQSGMTKGTIRDDLNLDLILNAYFKLTEISLSSEAHIDARLPSHEIYRQISILFMEGIGIKH